MLRHVTAPDGVRLACEVAGRGRPLVMVHGAGSARWAFDLVRPFLEERFTIWALDRRGRGDSSDRERYEIEREYDDVAQVVREAGPGAALFGHSYGGLVAAGAAARLGGALERLALYEPPMGGVLADAAWIARFEDQLRTGRTGEAVGRFLHDVGGYSHDEIAAMQDTPAWERRLAVAPTVPRELRAERALSPDTLGLEALELPCLLLLGTASPDWARRSAEAFAARLRRAAQRPLEGHGHGAAVSGPEVLAAELERFLDD